MFGDGARKRKKMLLGKEHPSILTSIKNLALVLRNHGKYELIQEQGRELHSLHGVLKTASSLEARNKKDYTNRLQDNCYCLPSLPIYLGVWRFFLWLSVSMSREGTYD